MRVIAMVLAIVFFVVGILYGLGKINCVHGIRSDRTRITLRTSSCFWVLALLVRDLGAVSERARR